MQLNTIRVKLLNCSHTQNNPRKQLLEIFTTSTLFIKASVVFLYNMFPCQLTVSQSVYGCVPQANNNISVNNRPNRNIVQ
jgi:hypothetical protein